VANAAKNLGMTVYGCDPYITIDAAWGLSSSIRKATTYEEIFEICDYITLHVPSTKDTKNMINAGSIARMKKGVKIINLARADLACISDLKAAIEDGHVSCYVTDFPTAELINVPGVITIPHLGASTEESEDNCAVMAADELIEFLNYGNIKNSVNYPAISMPATDAHRIIILHKNIPNMISHVSSTLAKQNINIENMANRSKNEYAVTLIDTYTNVTDDVLGSMKDMEGIIRAYCVH
jgi:D-3-phosphoglycerate dehydrogenase